MRRMPLLIVLLLFGLNVFAQNWIPIGPGGGSDLESIAIQPNNPDVVYIGGDIEGIFKTTDGGSTWNNINSNLAFQYSPAVYFIQEIIFDLSDNTYNSLFICTQMGLFKTTNGGLHWNLLYPKTITTESDFKTVSYLAQDPDDKNILFIGTGNAHENSDGSGNIFKSTDGGNTWNEIKISVNNVVIHGIFIDKLSPQNNRTIFVSTGEGIYKTTDNGVTWNLKNNGLPHNDVRRLYGVYVNNNLILFLSINTHGTPGNPGSFQGGIYKSTDGTDTWTSINGNLPQYQTDIERFYYYWKYTFDSTNPDIIYTATTRSMPEEGNGAYAEWGVYKTTNGGQSWSKATINVVEGWMKTPENNENHAFVLETAPGNPDIVYWGLLWMQKSTDAGNSWNQVYTNNTNGTWKTSGLEMMAVDDIAFDPIDQNIIYIGYDDFGPFRSTDGGNSFKPLDQVQDPYNGYDDAKNIVIDPQNSDVYLSRYEGLAGSVANNFNLGQVWKSTDNGNAWTKISSGLPDGTPYLIMDKISGSPGNRTLYCTIFHHGVYKSTNSGQSWFSINQGLAADSVSVWRISVNPSNSNELFIGLNNFGKGAGLYKSINAGNTWSKVNSLPNYDVLQIKYDKTSGNVYTSLTDNWNYNTTGGLYKSTDGGSSWNKIMDDSRIIDFEIDPANSDRIFAASQSWFLYNASLNPGIYLSENGGNNWTNITNGLSNTYIMFIKLNPFNHNQLYAGTNGGGVFVTNIVTGIETEKNILPKKFELFQNYPNPFNPGTVISFQLPAFSKVSLKIYDLLGRAVAILVNEEKPAGYYKINFDASKLSSGVYFYRIAIHSDKMTAGEYINSKKFILLK